MQYEIFTNLFENLASINRSFLYTCNINLIYSIIVGGPLITNWYFESEIFAKYLRLLNLSNKLGIYRKKYLFRENINDEIAKNNKISFGKKESAIQEMKFYENFAWKNGKFQCLS